MPSRPLTPRQRSRLKSTFPVGFFAAVMTACAVILVGSVLQFDPLAIVIRAGVSSLVTGCLVSFCVGIVRMSDAEQKRARTADRK